jgi:hypothetical protein
VAAKPPAAAAPLSTVRREKFFAAIRVLWLDVFLTMAFHLPKQVVFQPESVRYGMKKGVPVNCSILLASAYFIRVSDPLLGFRYGGL